MSSGTGGHSVGNSSPSGHNYNQSHSHSGGNHSSVDTGYHARPSVKGVDPNTKSKSALASVTAHNDHSHDNGNTAAQREAAVKAVNEAIAAAKQDRANEKTSFGKAFGAENVGMAQDGSLHHYSPTTGKDLGALSKSENKAESVAKSVTHDDYGDEYSSNEISNNLTNLQQKIDAENAWKSGDYGGWLSKKMDSFATDFNKSVANQTTMATSQPLRYAADLTRSPVGRVLTAMGGPVSLGAAAALQTASNINEYNVGNLTGREAIGGELSDIGSGLVGGVAGQALVAGGSAAKGNYARAGYGLGNIVGGGGLAGMAVGGMMGMAGKGLQGDLGSSTGGGYSGGPEGNHNHDSGRGSFFTGGSGNIGETSTSNKKLNSLDFNSLTGKKDVMGRPLQAAGDMDAFQLADEAFNNGDMKGYLDHSLNSYPDASSSKFDPTKLGDIQVDLSYLPGYNDSLLSENLL